MSGVGRNLVWCKQQPLYGPQRRIKLAHQHAPYAPSNLPLFSFCRRRSIPERSSTNYRQVLDAAAIRSALSLEMRIVTPLLLPGLVAGCFGSHLSLYLQRRLCARLNGSDRLDTNQRLQFQTLFRYRQRWRKAGHKFHCFFSPRLRYILQSHPNEKSRICRPKTESVVLS